MPKLATFEGCLTALVTPFRDGAVDFEALGKLVDWQIEQGVDGIVSVGTTGESATLDVDEHVAVIAAMVKAAKGRVPVIAGAGGNATTEALALTKASEQAGANGLLHVTPYYNRPNQEGLYRHFEAIAKSTKLPIILYNVPTRTACDLLTETVVRLAELDNVVAIKDATGNLVRGSDLVAKVGDRISILSGDDGTAFPLYAVGARGVISVVSNVAPRAMSDMWDAVKDGDWTRARKRHHELRVLNQMLFAEPSPAPTKAALALLGRCTPDVRLPLVAATPGLVEQLRAELKILALL
ncbi:MAG: 4-hydroxy-tetrahydrodipicolinate synthase [Deltaproteobacteria bacterium]|nr:4-hydroxy-tetrahydrodipicolinate synthase [Deltaproteobacteria bacterium]MCW5802563.1 4-hydroxy-tetrahydrodipicolinate synthase [Deltaproteobacteria bacterium]